MDNNCSNIDNIENQLKNIDNSINIDFCNNKNNCQKKNGIIIENIINNNDNNDIDCISIDEEIDNDKNDLIEDKISCDCRKSNSVNTIIIEGKIIFDLPLCYIHIKISKLKKYILSRLSKGLRIPINNIEILSIGSIDQQTELFWKIQIITQKMFDIIKLFPNPVYCNDNFIKVIHGLLYLVSKSFKDFPRKDLIGKNMSFYIFKYDEYEKITNLHISINI
jgi:hypothetical protein